MRVNAATVRGPLEKEYWHCRRSTYRGLSLTRFPPALQNGKFTRAGCSGELPPKLSGGPLMKQR